MVRFALFTVSYELAKNIHVSEGKLKAILFLIFFLPINAYADYYAKSMIYGSVCHLGITCSKTPIYAIKGEDNVLRHLSSVYPESAVSEVTGKYCHVPTKLISTDGSSNFEVFAWALNKATKKSTFFTRDSGGSYIEQDVDELVFECERVPKRY